VRNHHQFETETAQDIDAVYPARLLSDLVDLVDRQGETPGRQGGCAGSDETGAFFDAPGKDSGMGLELHCRTA